MYVFGISLIGFSCYSLLLSMRSQTPSQMQQSYKKITDGLISLRKEFSGSQSQVYPLLDQVDKMYSLSKNIYDKRKMLEQQINDVVLHQKNLEEENQALKDENGTLKHKLEVTNKVLEEASVKLVTESQRAQARSKENKSLQQQVAQAKKNTENVQHVEADVAEQLRSLAATQNLSLTSTSAPSSPR